ncbi:unnamed protein product [Cuscuta campestris]|uniref:Uncharacterized protein n=1 Tax=Cuscuta campestris TaxID=132261 RepID=A0A484M762_9ASTE|nr:unnamed protein product [Cuscuta campestris]
MKKVEDKLIPKTEDEFDAEDIKKVENYAKAINMLYYAVNPDDYRKISCCSTAKEMWDKLEVTYEGTDQVREAKIDFLTKEYEMFRMKEHENIDDLFDRFSKIVNNLHALKKTYTDRDLVRKILRGLTSEWRSKADAIYESIGTSNVTIDGLRAGHIKNKCPRNGRNTRHFKKQRAYISWGGDSGDESTDQDEDETAYLCLMAHEDQTDNKQEILNNEVVVIRELGITNLIRHSGAPTILSAPLDKRLLLYIITRILRPRDISHTSLFNEDLKAIHAIIHGASINWAKFVMIHMADCASIATERSLPYAFLVMDLIISADISIAGPDTKMTKIWIIQDSTFRKKSGDRDDAGPSRARAPARAPAPAPARASLQSIADTLNRLTLTVDGMGQSIERMDWTLQRQHHDMMAYFRGVNYVPPPFDSTILGQNIEGEDEDDDSYAPSSSPDEANFEDAVDGGFKKVASEAIRPWRAVWAEVLDCSFNLFHGGEAAKGEIVIRVKDFLSLFEDILLLGSVLEDVPKEIREVFEFCLQKFAMEIQTGMIGVTLLGSKSVVHLVMLMVAPWIFQSLHRNNLWKREKLVQSFPSEKFNLRNLKFVPIKGENLVTDISFSYCPVSEVSLEKQNQVICKGKMGNNYTPASLIRSNVTSWHGWHVTFDPLSNRSEKEVMLCMEKTRVGMQDLRTQVGQLATSLSRLESQLSNKLPSQSRTPNKSANAVTLRSGKALGESRTKEGEPKVNEERETEVKDDQIINTETPQLQKDASPTDEKVNSPLNSSLSPNVSLPPFPSKLAKQRKEDNEKDIWETFRKAEVNIPLIDAIKQVPRYAKFLKELCTNRRRLKGTESVSLSKNVSAILQRKLPVKCKDKVRFDIFEAMRYPSEDYAVFSIDAIDILLEQVVEFETTDTLGLVLEHSLDSKAYNSLELPPKEEKINK